MADLQIGDHVAGYRLLSEISEGGMGKVFLAEGPASERVALKVLAGEAAANDAFKARFLREVAHVRALQHPHIVPVMHSGEVDGVLFIAMAYIEGPDLRTVIAAEGVLDTDRTFRILAPISLALDAVHAAGLVHRDVKPGNVIVTGTGEDERGMLTDFGLTKSRSPDSTVLTGEGEFVGTHLYAAPEQILGHDAHPPADVYSLACVLFECLTGTPPFRHQEGAELLRAHIEEPPPRVGERRPSLAGPLDEVIARALAKEPQARFSSCTELISAARDALAPPAPAAQPAPAAAVQPATPPAAAGQPVAAPAGEAAVAEAAPAGADAPPGEVAPLRLKVVHGNASGEEIEVADELLFGRQAGGPGQLAGDIEISRSHARVSRAGAGFVVEDLGSTNGTFLNGRRITGAEQLAPGDEVQLGATRLVVESAAPQPSAPAGETASPPAPVDPAGATAVAGPERPPRVNLRIQLDLEAGEAEVFLDEGAETVRLAWDGDAWRLRPGSP